MFNYKILHINIIINYNFFIYVNITTGSDYGNDRRAGGGGNNSSGGGGGSNGGSGGGYG